MERMSRRERRTIQGALDRIRRERVCPVEMACCGVCDYLIRVYLGEDGLTKACPRCSRNRQLVGGRRRALAGVG